MITHEEFLKLKSRDIIYVPINKEERGLERNPSNISYETEYVKAEIRCAAEYHVHIDFPWMKSSCRNIDKDILPFCYLSPPILKPPERELWSARTRFYNPEVK